MSHEPHIKEGFVMKTESGLYISGITTAVTNDQFESQEISASAFFTDAKIWKTHESAIMAARRIVDQVGKCRVCKFSYDEDEDLVFLGKPIPWDIEKGA